MLPLYSEVTYEKIREVIEMAGDLVVAEYQLGRSELLIQQAIRIYEFEAESLN